MKRGLNRSLILLLVLAVLWVLWSGIYTPLVLGLGVLSCLLTLWLAYRIRYFDREVFSLNLVPRLPRYWGWLVVEIVKSSLEVAQIVLKKKMPISPTVVEFEAGPKDAVGQAILGNSITLTPGTVTLDIYENRISVHCLTQEGAEALLTGEFNRRVTTLTKR